MCFDGNKCNWEAKVWCKQALRIKRLVGSRSYQGRELYVQFHLTVSVNEQGRSRRGKSRTSINRALAAASLGRRVGSNCDTALGSLAGER
jgi:hypothetical protein